MKDEKTMFNWDKEKIRWNIICSQTNQMNEQICQKIKNYIQGKNIAEFGCGTGYFSLSMSKYANIVISADIQSQVLEVLERNIAKYKINNVIPIKTDVYKNYFYNIDYIVAKFFSRPTKDLKSMLSMAKQGVILVLNSTTYSGMNTDEISKTKKENADIVCPYLEREKISYEKIDMICENGQYLKDEQEVIRFLEAYTKNTYSQIQEIIKQSKLKEDFKYENEKFNYFVSVDKHISILIIESQSQINQ